MKHSTRSRRGLCVAVLLVLCPLPARAADWTVVGWNNLGMHCMDGDYSVLSLLPPYNTLHAQLIDPTGALVRDPAAQNIVLTYQAVADPEGSINSTSIGKTNFWDHVGDLFGATPAPDVGLTGLSMPGAANVPQPMSFDGARAWFIAEGIPITPYDDQGKKNSYPLMRIVARQGATVLATTGVVLPVSDEMDCSSCHASGSVPTAQPLEGWVYDANPQRDMRLNILRLHDDRVSFLDSYQQAAAALGYNAAGLYATAVDDGRAILCASCHLSEALPGSGQAGISSLTAAVHRRMAFAYDPKSGGPLDAMANRSACYRCHPGSVTRCLRGAMGKAVAADGSLAMQCQSCHGHMLDVAADGRTGWLDEPRCQSCHTGTAVKNNGQIRYTSVFEDDGSVRVAVDSTYATNPDTPAPGFSLYRFSTGHGGLTCEACHGSTHAEFPSSHRNDNLQSIAVQGHVGVLTECTSCHAGQQLSPAGGPHGMHPVGQEWVDGHSDFAEEGNVAACRDCHGADLRGTVLSRSQADRNLGTNFGSKHFWRGFQIGCYACHNGPNSEHANPNHPPVADDANGATVAGSPLDLTLVADDADGNPLTLRIVSQPQHGTVALDGDQARYFPDHNYSGSDSFTFAAWDGAIDSNLATVSINVAPLVGDANCDDLLSAADISAVLLRIGNENAPVCDADVDNSGTVDGADVDKLVKLIFGS